MADIIKKETTTTIDGNAQNDKPISDSTPSGGEKAGKSQTMGYIIYFLFGVIEILLIFRLVFKLTGASPDSGFVNFIYSLTQMFISPFIGIFPQATTSGVVTTAVLEPSTLVAIVVYGVLAWGITQIVLILSRRMQ